MNISDALKRLASGDPLAKTLDSLISEGNTGRTKKCSICKRRHSVKDGMCTLCAKRAKEDVIKQDKLADIRKRTIDPEKENICGLCRKEAIPKDKNICDACAEELGA